MGLVGAADFDTATRMNSLQSSPFMHTKFRRANGPVACKYHPCRMQRGRE
jgi:hypothetical protein